MNEFIDQDPDGEFDHYFVPQFQAGDRLWYWKSAFKTIQHVGLVIRQDMVLENYPGVGERVVPLSDFLARAQVYRGRREGWNQIFESRLQAILRNPKNYNFVGRNCQATVNEVISGKPVSEQVNAAVGIAALVGLALILIKSSKA